MIGETVALHWILILSTLIFDSSCVYPQGGLPAHVLAYGDVVDVMSGDKIRVRDTLWSVVGR